MAKLLVVDDEPDVRHMLRDNLRLQGHEVDIAASAAEALKMATATAYDLAIIDYVLPGMRGLELLHQLHKINRFMRSVIISGQLDHDVLEADDLEKQLKEKISADRYLAKPVGSEALQRAVEELCKPSMEGDWKKLASDARDAGKVTVKEVRSLDRKLSKTQKKRK
jgi:CheY-like chemotaxis protein